MSFGWGKGGKVTPAGWQVTLCDPIWHVIVHSGLVIFAYELLCPYHGMVWYWYIAVMPSVVVV